MIWTPERLAAWGEDIAANTAAYSALVYGSTPGRVWYEARKVTETSAKRRAWIADVLGMAWNGYGCAGLAADVDGDGQRRILAAFAPPPTIDTAAVCEWRAEDVLTVLEWRPGAETQILGDTGPRLIAPDNADTIKVYTDTRLFLRDWIAERAIWLETARIANETARAFPLEPVDGCLPGALAIGPLNKQRWSDVRAKVIEAFDPAAAKTINSAIFRAARLPRVQARISR